MLCKHKQETCQVSKIAKIVVRKEAGRDLGIGKYRWGGLSLSCNGDSSLLPYENIKRVQMACKKGKKRKGK